MGAMAVKPMLSETNVCKTNVVGNMYFVGGDGFLEIPEIKNIVFRTYQESLRIKTIPTNDLLNISRFHKIPGELINGPYFFKNMFVSFGFAHAFNFVKILGLPKIFQNVFWQSPLKTIGDEDFVGES